MVRKRLLGTDSGEGGAFRRRGRDVSRVEGLTDGVFAFAITLLVVSLEVPKTFHELMEVMRGLFAFAVSFTVLLSAWHSHYRFFRRYGLDDGPTLLLNGALLFVILFYVYPLKFLFGLLMGPVAAQRITPDEVPSLMLVYGVGYCAVALLFALLYLHAYREREILALDAREEFETRWSIYTFVIQLVVGLLSVLLTIAVPAHCEIAGWIYGLLLPALTAHGVLRRRGRAQFAEVLA
jgi:uncharacterized membrane protein